MRALVAVSLALALTGCDAWDQIRMMIDSGWTVEDANGSNGNLHFGVNPWALKSGYPENVRVERVEHRTMKQPNGNPKEETRERKIRILTARCESKSICDAEPHDSDAREIHITPKIMGSTKVYVSASIDEDEVVKDSIIVTVQN
jgi:hypothetical protein